MPQPGRLRINHPEPQAFGIPFARNALGAWVCRKRLGMHPLTLVRLRAQYEARRWPGWRGRPGRRCATKGRGRSLSKAAASSPASCVRARPPLPISHGPLVSVVIPVYDRTSVLRESIDSILGQDYPNFEVLLACDGSPPETLAVVEEYADHPQVRIFSWPENSGGPVKGRNLMIAQARGKYIAFQDSDDVAEPGRLRACVNALEEGTAEVVYGGFRA